MKSLKPFVLVLAGMLITVALFSFKNETPKKEYLLLELIPTRGLWKITNPDLTEKVYEKGDIRLMQVKIFNELSSQGWEYKGEAGGLCFERVKQ